jgi:flagellar basal-body rod modification protein FlgD
MSKVNTTTSTNFSNSTSTTSAANSLQGGGLNDVDVSQFLNLMITELQNQDPLNPTDNAALMEQVGQLRSISANDTLIKTLTSFSTTQELTTASGLIGKKGLDSDAKEVNGAVSSVSVKIDEKDRNKRQVQVHVGAQIVDMNNIREIVEE